MGAGALQTKIGITVTTWRDAICVLDISYRYVVFCIRAVATAPEKTQTNKTIITNRFHVKDYPKKKFLKSCHPLMIYRVP